jgi:hypothetical protein
MRLVLVLGLVTACKSDHILSTVDAPPTGEDAATEVDASIIDAPPAASKLGTVSNVVDLAACPRDAPLGSTCKRLTVGGCAGIEDQPIEATIAIVATIGSAAKGTVVHFSGGGGQGFRNTGVEAYRTAGFLNVLVSWATDWEQTKAEGIRTAGCRPSTVLKWIFDEPKLHAASRTRAFCGEGFSGGAGQLGYALAHYGMSEYLDYVNALSGPPFGRIDLGCDGDAPATAVVCGATVTTRLPRKLDAWENIQPPLFCGATGVPAAELARWKADSIAIGGTYAYPNTQVAFFACTNQATAVTALGKLYFDEVAAASGGDLSRASYACYTQADGCLGENLGTGARDAERSLIANCVPRH